MGIGKYLPGSGQNDYLTESHKIYEYIFYNRLFTKIIFFVIFFVIGFVFMNSTKDYFYKEEDRIALQKIKEYRKQADEKLVNKQMDSYTYGYYVSYLAKKEEEIRNKYGSPIFVWNLLNYRYPFFYPLFFIVLFLLGFYLWKKKVESKLDNFFYQVSEPEPAMSKPSKLVDLTYLKDPSEFGLSITPEFFNSVFKDFDKFVEYVSSGTAGLFKKENVKKEFTKFYESIKKDIELLGIDKTEFLYFCLILLTHSEALNYGSVPTGLISTTIKDYTLKKMLSMYYRMHVPVLYDVKGEFIERDYKAHVYLKAFYSYYKKGDKND